MGKVNENDEKMKKVEPKSELKNSPTPRNSYKQQYRKAWEELPEFSGWLEGVPNSTSRAFCRVCNKNLHAHRLTLLKHTVSTKHMKLAKERYELMKQILDATKLYEKNEKFKTAGEAHEKRKEDEKKKISNDPNEKIKKLGEASEKQKTRSEVNKNLETNEVNEKSETDCQKNLKPKTTDEGIAKLEICSAAQLKSLVNSKIVTIEICADTPDLHMDCSNDLAGDDEDKNTDEAQPKSSTNNKSHNHSSHTEDMSLMSSIALKPPITTHVLDTAKGLPVQGLPVSLYQLVDGRWTFIHESFTNPDGRCTDFISREEFKPGRFKLHFDTDKYYELRKKDRLYPFIEIVFDVRSPSEHLHIPLLMTPYGYTTYRGS